MKDIPLRVRISPIHETAIDMAGKLWPGVNRSELVRRIIEDWHNQREANGGKATQIISATEKIVKDNVDNAVFTILEAISHVQPPLY